MCPLEAQEGETGRGELYGAIARRASDGDRWAKIARANEHKKKAAQRDRERKREVEQSHQHVHVNFFFFFLQVFNTQDFQRFHTCCSLQSHSQSWFDGLVELWEEQL